MSPYSSSAGLLHSSLFGSPLVSELLGDRAAVAAMLEFEAALARVQGRLGVIPAGAARAIDGELGRLDPDALDWQSLAAGTRRDGVPVPALVRQLRGRLAAAGATEAAQYLHWGATSQDVVDTAFVLRLRRVLIHVDDTLSRIVARLSELARDHRDTPMLGRTHGRHAVPITFGLKVANWLQPMYRQRARLTDTAASALALQLGGAAGTLATLGPAAVLVRRDLAAELALSLPAAAWHTARDSFGALASQLTGAALGAAKIAQDVILLSQEEVGEIRLEGPGGGSSAMPNKSNPTQAELVIALARSASALAGSLAEGALVEHERGTYGWHLEWLSLPPLLEQASAALERLETLIESLRPEPEAMLANLASARGLPLAEAARAALIRGLPGVDADGLVAAAVEETRSSADAHLVEALRKRVPSGIDWDAITDPALAVGAAGVLVDGVLLELEGSRGDAGTEGGDA